MRLKLNKVLFVSVEEKGTENEYHQVHQSAEAFANPEEKKEVGRYVLESISTVESVPKITPK